MEWDRLGAVSCSPSIVNKCIGDDTKASASQSLNQYKIIYNLQKSSTLHKYILNNSKHKQINATPKNIKLIFVLF